MKAGLFRGRRLYYGWVVVGVAVVVAVLVYGARHSFSVFFVAILDEFGWSRSDTALIFSLNVLSYGLMALLAGTLVDRLGARKVLPVGALLLGGAMAACSQASQLWHFYLLFGLAVPLATALAGFPVMAPTVVNWFPKRRGTALGLFQAGIGFSFLMGFVAQLYINAFEWRWAYVAMGGMVAVVVVPMAAIFMRSRPRETGLVSNDALPASDAEEGAPTAARQWTSVEWTMRRALRTYRFWALFFAMFLFWGLGIYLVLTHAVRFAVDMGYTQVFGAFVFGVIFGIFSGIGHGSGFISDYLGREWTYTVGTVGSLAALLALVLVADATHPWMLYFTAIVLGLFSGVVAPTTTAATADLFHGRHFGAINSMVVAGFGAGGALGPWLGGKLFDVQGNYTLAFIISMVGIALACGCMWLAAPRKARPVRQRPIAPVVAPPEEALTAGAPRA